MRLGFYYGNNQALGFCSNCGHDFIDGDECPVCHSKDLIKITRMNGYLGYE